MENYLLITVLIIFILALVSSFMRHRHLDRVLRKLRGFHVTAQIGSDRVWGRFRLYSNAIELLFSQPLVNHRGARLGSYILFREQMGAIESIFRFHDELTPEHQQFRMEEIERVRNPGLRRRVGRRVRNFTAMFRDAISESIGMMASRVQQHASLAMLQKSEGKKLQQVGNEMLDMAANTAYDPVLEHYIFRRVVFEVNTGEDEKAEYSGILEEYSSSWVSILDCFLNAETRISLMDPQHLMVQRNMDFEVKVWEEEGGLHLTLGIVNRNDQDIHLLLISGPEGYQHRIGETLSPGASHSIRIRHLPEASLVNVDRSRLPVSLQLVAPERQAGTVEESVQHPLLPELTLAFHTCRGVDIYIPRSKGVLRHAGDVVE